MPSLAFSLLNNSFCGLCEVLSDLLGELSQVWVNMLCAWQQKELWFTKLELGYSLLSFPVLRDITLQECSSSELVKTISSFFNSENPDCAIRELRAGLYYVNMEGGGLLDTSLPLIPSCTNFLCLLWAFVTFFRAPKRLVHIPPLVTSSSFLVVMTYGAHWVALLLRRKKGQTGKLLLHSFCSPNLQAMLLSD